MVTSDEIEEQIVELHKERKTSKEISKVVHKNFTFIGAVLRKRFPEEYIDADNNEANKETEALKLFSEKKSPTEVAIKLALNFDQTEKVYLDFLRLQGLFELYKIYLEHKPKLRIYLWFIRQLRKRRNISIKNLKDVLSVLDNNKAFRDELKYFGENIMPKFRNTQKSSCENNSLSRLGNVRVFDSR
jgi:hypothetical protein